MQPSLNKAIDQSAISRIRVDRLFGHFSYDLVPSTLRDPQLLILYGANGSGKTTILKLLFYLLSDRPGSGHKTRLLRTPFARLSVELASDTEVVAERMSSELVGPLRCEIRLHGAITARVELIPDERGIPLTPELTAFFKALSGLNLVLFFLSDDRELISNVPPKSEPTRFHAWEQAVAHPGPLVSRPRPQRRTGHAIDNALKSAMNSATEWAREQARGKSQQGDADVTGIYAQVVRTLSSPTRRKVPPQSTLPLIREVLHNEARRSNEFLAFGLPAAGKVDELLLAMKGASRGLRAIVTIVTPYIEGIKAKLDALQELHDRMATFVKTVNNFFSGKRIELNLNTGLSILSSDGVVLQPANLSSGEKQILLIFCNALVARPRGNIFIIDEPELSLNIEWQRELIRSLLEAAKGREIQFVLATHSFELLAPHADSVLQLKPGQSVVENVFTKA